MEAVQASNVPLKQMRNTAVKNKEEFFWDAHFLVALSCISNWDIIVQGWLYSNFVHSTAPPTEKQQAYPLLYTSTYSVLS